MSPNNVRLNWSISVDDYAECVSELERVLAISCPSPECRTVCGWVRYRGSIGDGTSICTLFSCGACPYDEDRVPPEFQGKVSYPMFLEYTVMIKLFLASYLY